MGLRLRPFRPADEAAAIAVHEALAAEDFTFLLGWEPGMDWGTFLQLHSEQRRGVNVEDGRVPAALLAADVNGELVGRASVRFSLNEWLAERGGHIGYGVAPQARRRGYATEILRQSLVIARSEGVDSVLVCCNDDNLGSAGAIERCGGVLESLVQDPPGSDGVIPVPVRRYWIH